MKNKIIGIDLDEVLAELLDLILKKNNYKISNYDIIREEVKDYYIHKMPNIDITIDEAIDWFKKPMLDDIDKCDLVRVEGSYERLLELKANGNKLIIVTARIEEIFGEYTRKWLNTNFPEIFDEIIYTNHFTDKHRHKGEVCKELGISYMIEDNMDYALDLADNGIKTYLLTKPWNSHRKEEHENLIKIDNWNEFRIR